MADINQSLGLDAQQAIKELGRLAVTIDVANAAIGRLQKNTAADPTGQVASAAKQAQSSINGLNRTVGKFKNGVEQAGVAGKRAGDNILLSWQNVSKILATQTVIRGLTGVINTFSQASEAALEFQLTIARTAAIAGSGAGSSYAALSAEVRQLALDLGQPIADVQSAAFQTLQNDVGNVTESFQFLRNASELAIATGAELETSVNSLTSIQKAYGQSSEEAARNADILFKTVDVGRVSLDELENRLGTITPQAAALGVQFEETAAAVASLTLSGLDTAKAATQLRNIMAKLIRPTTDLQNAFERLGVTSGQELVQQYGGLQGALQALTRAFNGNETAVANAFGTIRGQLGVLNLLANEGEEFNRVLGEIRENSAGSLEAAVGEVNQTNAREFEKAMAKVNDTLLELGNTSLKIKTNLAEAFNIIIPNAQTAISVVTAFGAAAVVAFNGYILAAGRAAIATTAALGPLGILATVLAGVAAFDYANTATLESSLANIAKAASDAQREVDALNERTSREVDKAFTDSLNKQKKALEDFTKEASVFYEDIRRVAEDSFQRIDITSLRTITDFADAREELVKDLYDFIDSIDGRIKDSFDSVREAQQDLEEFRFERSIRGLSEAQQVQQLLIRSADKLRQAREAAATAGFDEEKRAIQNQLQLEGERAAQDALRIADRLKGASLVDQAEDALANSLQQRIQLEQQLGQSLANLNQNDLLRQADEAERIRQDLASLTSELQTAVSRRDAEGKLRGTDPKSLAEQNQNIERIRNEIATLEGELSQIQLIDDANLRQTAEKIRKRFEEGIAQARIDFSSSLDDLRSELSQTEFKSTVRLDPLLSGSAIAAIRDQVADAVTGEDFGQRVQQAIDVRNNIVQQQQDAQQEVDKLNGALQVQSIRIREIAKETVDLGKKSAAETLGDIFQGDKDTLVNEFRAVQAARTTGTELETLFQKVRNEGVTSIDEVEQRLLKLEGSFSSALGSDQIQVFQEGIKIVREAITNVENQAKAIEQVTISPFDLERIQQEAIDISEKLKPVTEQFQKANEEAGKGADSVSRINTNLSTTSSQAASAALQARSLADELQRAALAQSALSASAGGVQTAYFGSPVYRANGGDLTRGQDNQLVAAAAGETITNARSSRAFFAELRAINSGNAPVYREQGGPVTNIGDINVNVDARNAQNVDGRQIARQLNRELRRGSSNLRG